LRCAITDVGGRPRAAPPRQDDLVVNSFGRKLVELRELPLDAAVSSARFRRSRTAPGSPGRRARSCSPDASRRTSSRRAAGTIASRSGTRPRSASPCTRAGTSRSPPSRACRRRTDQDAGEDRPRLVTRHRAAHGRDRREQDAGVDRALSPRRRPEAAGKSSAPYVFSRYSAGRSGPARTFSSSRYSISTSPAGSSRDRSASSCPGTTTAPSPRPWLERRAQRELHVGRRELYVVSVGADEDPTRESARPSASRRHD
jgi:hypothetical protein